MKPYVWTVIFTLLLVVASTLVLVRHFIPGEYVICRLTYVGDPNCYLFSNNPGTGIHALVRMDHQVKIVRSWQ